MYLESDAGLGKSTLVSALSHNPGIRRKSVTRMKTPTGEAFDIEGRDAHLVKIQVCDVIVAARRREWLVRQSITGGLSTAGIHAIASQTRRDELHKFGRASCTERVPKAWQRQSTVGVPPFPTSFVWDSCHLLLSCPRT